MIKRHSPQHLNMLKYWSPRYPFELMEEVRLMFDKAEQVTRQWYKDEESQNYFLEVRMSVKGSFGNESIIKALLSNEDIKKAHYLKWERDSAGEIHTFRILPHLFDYIKVSKFVIDNRMSRQQVYNNEKLYEWLKVSENVRLIRRRF